MGDFSVTAAKPSRRKYIGRHMKPLGTNLFSNHKYIQKEKLAFRENVRTLSQLCEVKRALASAQRRRHQQHINNQIDGGRWKPSIQETERLNNAEVARFHNRITDRVVSASFHSRGQINRNVQDSQCHTCAHVSPGEARVQRLAYCDILGQYYCVDCSRERKQGRFLRKQETFFPDIEPNPRSLIAPTKLRSAALSLRSGKESNSPLVDNANSPYNPKVFTEHEIALRLKRSLQIETLNDKQKTPLPEPLALQETECSEPGNKTDQQSSDIKVTVTFSPS